MSQNREKIDLRGLSCPEPVIKTKKLLDSPSTATVEALVDDQVCVNNLQRLARSLKTTFAVEKNDGYYTITLEKNGTASAPHVHEVPTASKPAAPGAAVGTVLLISKDHLGEGDPEFSKTLMNLFLQTTFESGLRPRAILMMNTGVRLMAKNSQTLKVLNDFQDAGCEVFACGLCVEFYGLKGEVPTEQITSMFAICEYLFAADRIIQP